MRRTSRSEAVSLLTVVVLLVGACTRSGDDLVELGAESARGGDPAAASEDTSVEAALDRGDFGTLEAVCGPAPSGRENGATAGQGVDADRVAIGTFADPGNQARPGLNQELFDTADVFTAWCNELGGINGRQIELRKHDAGLFQYQARMVEACESDFVLVGGGAVFDDAGQETRLRCLLPDIPGFRATPEAIGADLSAAPTPAGLDAVGFGVGPHFTAEFPDAVDDVGILTGNVGTTITQADSYQQAGEHFGWTFTYSDQYNAIGESTWVPYAQKIAESGVRGLVYVGEPENLGLLVQAFQQIGYHPDWVLGTPNVYDPKLVQSGGAALADIPVYTWIASTPFEYADRSPSVQALRALFARYKPDAGAPTFLGVSSLSAWLLFAEAAKACGADLTRRCVLDQAQELTPAWDAGGLAAPAGENCSLTVKATPDGFEVLEWQPTNDYYTCSPDNVVELREPIGEGVRLEDVGLSLDDLE